MRNHRPLNNGEKSLSAWPWVNPYYRFSIPVGLTSVKGITIDQMEWTLDMYRINNIWPKPIGGSNNE
jgi:hypothetical protein